MNSRKIAVFLGVILLALVAFFFVGREAAESAGPSSPIYSIGRGYESVELKFASLTGGSLEKAEIHLKHAEKRLEDIAEIVGDKDVSTLTLMGYAYAQEEEIEPEETELTEEEVEEVEELTEDYEESMDNAMLEIEDAQEDGLDADEVSEIVATATVRHQEVLEEVLSKVPEQAQEAIRNAMAKGEIARERAIDGVSGEKREEVREMVEQKKQEAESRRQEALESRPEIPFGEESEEEGEGEDSDQGLGNTPDTPVQGKPENVPPVR